MSIKNNSVKFHTQDIYKILNNKPSDTSKNYFTLTPPKKKEEQLVLYATIKSLLHTKKIFDLDTFKKVFYFLQIQFADNEKFDTAQQLMDICTNLDKYYELMDTTTEKRPKVAKLNKKEDI